MVAPLGPASVAMRETLPVAVPLVGVTLIFTVTFSAVLWVMPAVGLRVSVVAVATVLTVPHFVARLLTFTEPRPVTRS